MKNLAALEFLIFKRGGVTGAVRRIVFRWRGYFSASQIKLTLAKRYPLLVPAVNQVEDALESMERARQICVAFCGVLEKYFQLNRRGAR